MMGTQRDGNAASLISESVAMVTVAAPICWVRTMRARDWLTSAARPDRNRTDTSLAKEIEERLANSSACAIIPSKPLQVIDSKRRDGRVVEGARLESNSGDAHRV